MRRLESRLLRSHLFLAALPTILLVFLGYGAVRFLVQRTQGEEVEKSFTRSTALSHALVNRIEADAVTLLASLPEAPPAPDREDDVRRALTDAGFAFAAWRAGDGDAVVVAAGPIAPDPDALPDAADWARLAEDRSPVLVRGDAFRFFDGEGRAVAYRPDPGILEAVARAPEDYARYRQLFRVERVYASAFAFALGALLLLAAIVAYLVARATARRISRPVTDLAHAADRLAAGDLAHRAPAPAGSSDEIADLVTAFNRMGAQLERSRDELLRAERLAAWRDVARRVAHEIRNPLTPISLAVHRLGKRLGDDPAARESLTSIGEEIDNLRRISEVFSEFAKMPDAEPAPTDLAHIASSVVELYRDSVPGVALELDGPDSLPIVGDRDLLRRAVANLVKNAGEALAATGGTIRVALRRDGSMAMVEVSDDGPGVPEEIRDTLFRPGVSARPGGSGLGLAMVQRIASDHRGALQWKAADPGSVFTIRIPIRESEVE